MKVPGGLTGERALALAGLGGLLAVLVACVAMIAGAVGGGEEEELPVAAATATPTPTPTPTPEPTPVPLTRAQRAARAAAAEIVASRGFEVVRLRDYDPRRTLRVLIGHQSYEPQARLAFFFVRDSYIGNDTSEASTRLKVRRRRDTRVTLSYGVYAPDDEVCCPSGGPVNVRFEWDGSSLAPLDPLPPAAQRSPGYQPQ